MRCLAPAEIDRYVSGVMDEVVAGGVTQHLAGCGRCRETVARTRASTAETYMSTAAEDEGSQVTHLPVRCRRCGAQYAIPEERARGRRLTVRCMSCGGQMAVEGDDSAISSPSLASISGLSSDTGEQCWYLIEDRQRMGPYSELDLLKKMDRGQIDGESHVWRDGYKEWRRLRSLPQFKAIFDRAQPEPRISPAPLLPPPDSAPPGYDAGRVANSMQGRQDVGGHDQGDDPEGWRGSTDQLPLISSVTPGPVDQSQSNLRTAIIDPVEEEEEESGVRTVLRDPPEQSEIGVKTVLLEGEGQSEGTHLGDLHGPEESPSRTPRVAAFRMEERDLEGEPSTALHEPGYSPETENAQRLALARSTSDDGDPTRPRPRIERTEEIQTPEAAGPAPISDDARTRLHYQHKDPREGLLDEEEGAADELAPLFDGGGLEPLVEAPLGLVQTAAAPALAPSPSRVAAPLQAAAPERMEQPLEPPAAPVLVPGAWDRRMHGQREDNSVLFSLQHLKNLSGPRGLPGLPREESGLVDIQAIPVDAPAPAPVPLMLPSVEESGGNRVAMFFTVGMMGALLGAFALLGLLYLARPDLFSALLAPGDRGPKKEAMATTAPPPTKVATPAPAATPAVSDKVAAPDAGAPVADLAAEEPPPAADPQPVPSPQRPPAPAKLAKRSPRPAPAKPANRPAVDLPPDDSPARPSRTPRPAPTAAPSRTADIDPFAGADKPKPKPRATSSDQELDDLINAATTGDLPPPRKTRPASTRRKPRPAPAPAAKRTSNLPERLTRNQVAAGMKRATPAVTRCRTTHDRVGLVTVSVTITGATGRIGKGTALGPLGNSPVGACVLKAVKASATFPQFSGAPMTIKYPFILR